MVLKNILGDRAVYPEITQGSTYYHIHCQYYPHIYGTLRYMPELEFVLSDVATKFN